MIINIIFQNSFSEIFYKYFVNKFCDRYFRNRDPSHKKSLVTILIPSIAL